MLAGMFGKTGPGAVKLPQPSIADVAKHGAQKASKQNLKQVGWQQDEDEDSPPYVTESPAYSEGPTKFGSASGPGGGLDSQTSRTNHTRLDEPAYAEPAVAGRHLADVSAALAATAARTKKQGGTGVGSSSSSSDGGGGRKESSGGGRKEGSPWVHVGKPKTKEEGKVWQLRHHVGPFFLSFFFFFFSTICSAPMPPHEHPHTWMRHTLCVAPFLRDADWRLQSDVQPDSRRFRHGPCRSCRRAGRTARPTGCS